MTLSEIVTLFSAFVTVTYVVSTPLLLRRARDEGANRERQMWLRFMKDHQGMSVGAALECMLHRDHPHE